MFEKKGYTAIKRYPSVARWNPTMDYTNASIAAFQPYVISGEVEPPANPLIIPQFCLRFGDTDNVGVTMSHNTGFVMIGQHMFVAPKDWDQNKVFKDMLDWNIKGLGLKKEDMVFHEDAWAGGGNLGCCMEMFSCGCELWNQVYMLYEQTNNGVKDLKIKVLDMGLGMERNAWFSQGTPTSYDAVFPKVLEELRKKIGLKYDEKLLRKYTPYASLLNNDEVEDIDDAWKQVAKKMGMGIKELKDYMMPTAALYSIAEHMRSVLVILNDGGLPSNVGGGYNLRMLIRRSLSLIEQQKWDIDIYEVCEMHAKELKALFPELSEKLEDIKKILEVEKKKYIATKEKTARVIESLKEKKLDEEKLLELYDSQGISPDMLGLKVPENFYAKVTERHEAQEQEAATTKSEEYELQNVTETKALYFENYQLIDFKAKVLKVIGDIVVLDQTAFYPTSGGQIHDIGNINGFDVMQVWKQGNVILHRINGELKVGEQVKGHIDFERRLQLAQHHTATHIVNAAARKVLGEHVNQAGAFKDIDKARLDITHYEAITDEELKQIERVANEIVNKRIEIIKKFYSRNDAEKKFGMSIYQGGAVPGKQLRIVEIKGVDVEACGGTHLDNTKEVGVIKILKTTKIQDGVVRIIFAAGKAAFVESHGEEQVVDKLKELLKCEKEEIPGRCAELFELWKNVVKKKKVVEKKLISKTKFEGDVVVEACKVLKTQQEHLVKTIERFMNDLKL
jgi:alanyl-tRNA synthetase